MKSIEDPNTTIKLTELFVNQTNGVAFTLVVDDFLIKYKDREAVDHLLTVLRELYTITTEVGATQKSVGITLHHNKAQRYIDMSIPGYVKKAIQRFKRENLKALLTIFMIISREKVLHQKLLANFYLRLGQNNEHTVRNNSRVMLKGSHQQIM